MFMNFKYFNLIFMIFFIFLISMGVSFAEDFNETDLQMSSSVADVSLEDCSQESITVEDIDEVSDENSDFSKLESVSDDEIIVNDWNDLQYYCSLKDKDYTLKLKENTNYYPTDCADSNYQIKINNNVKIIGNNGAYIGDTSPNPNKIDYVAMVVPEKSKVGITLQGITFKWIRYTDVFLHISGSKNNLIKDCYFNNIEYGGSKPKVIDIDNGDTLFDNCTFINCTSAFGCINVYDSANYYKTVHVAVMNSYFENNYAVTCSPCIQNCGLLDVYNSTFCRNSAGWWAGAIHTRIAGTTNIYNSFFQDNVAGWNGGALYTYANLNIYNCSFIGNNCTTNNGGGVIGACYYISVPHIYVENSLFKDNENTCWDLDELSTTGTGRGGAISLMDEGSLEVLNSTFIKNSASIGTAICALEMGSYGSPDVIIKGNKFIDHTRARDVIVVTVKDTICDISDNYYLNNSIEFSMINLEVLECGDESAKLKVTSVLRNPSYYDKDILEKTLYDVYVDGVYYKTVNSSIFNFDFEDLDICRLSVVPTIGNVMSNEVLLTSTREYIFVSKSKGNDANDGLSRETPVSSISKAIQLAKSCKNILIIDGEFNECNLNVDYDLTIKGENNCRITGLVTNNVFNVVNSMLTLKNIRVDSLKGNSVNFIKQTSGKLVVDKCLFSFNDLNNVIDCNELEMINSKFISNSGSIKVSSNVFISNSIINNNKNTVIYKNTDSNVVIRNSVLLNNSDIIGGNKNNVNLDSNWWGNTLTDFEVCPNADVNDWLFLNVNVSDDSLEFNQKATVEYCFNLIKSNGSIFDYDEGTLPNFDLSILTLNGKSDKQIVNFADRSTKLTFTLTKTDTGVLTASYNNVKFNTNFKFIKSAPKVTVFVNDVDYGANATVDVFINEDMSGEITLKLNNLTKTQEITSSRLTFTLDNLNSGQYDVIVSYGGSDKYNSSEIKAKFNVNRIESQTIIDVGPVCVREDVKLNITVPSDATGNITIIVNDIDETFEITNPKMEYTINYVTRGDYLIKAIYNGDNKYLPSEESYYFEVDKLNSTINVNANNITYGENVIVEVTLDTTATGSVTVIIDDKSNSSSVINGKSIIYVSNVDAGENKEVIIKYSGDKNYTKITYNTTFTVFKTNIDFKIDIEDIKIGRDAIAHINLPLGVTGTFTFRCGNLSVIKTIPRSGEVSWSMPDLDIGNYTVSAVYEGNNYFTAENSSSFSVLEYPPAQWSNIGGNAKNTGKSDYESDVNGNVRWSNLINATVTGNIAIDSEGNVYVTTDHGIYSFDFEGNLRWIFDSDTFEGDYSGICIGRDVIVAPKSGDTLYFINQGSGSLFGNSNIYQGSSLFEPVIDDNANVYISSEYQTQSSSYNLVIVPYKIWEKDGSPILVKLLSKPISAPILINDDLVLMICENKITIINSSSLKSVINKNGNYSSTRAVIGNGDIIYMFLNDNLIALNIDGSQVWKTKVSGGVGNCLVLDNEIGLYAVNSRHNLYQYDLISGHETKFTDLLVTSGVLIGNDGNIYFGSEDAFYSLDCEGNMLWKTVIGSKIIGSPVMDSNGVIYLTTSDNRIFALNFSSLKNSNLDVVAQDIYLGEDLIINVTIDEDATGYLTIEFNGEIFNQTAKSFVRNVSNLNRGNYTLKIFYSGDNKFKQSFYSQTITVGKFKPAMLVNAQDIEFGEVLNLNIILNDDAEGNVTVNIDNNEFTQILTNSMANFTFSGLNGGIHDINVSYSGDVKYSAFSVIKRVIVGPENVSIYCPSIVCYGIGKLSATVKDSNNNPINNLSIQINVGGMNYSLLTNSLGIVSLDDLQLPLGSYDITINFNGTDRYASLMKSSTLTLLSSVQASDMVIGYNSGKDFQAIFLDSKGNKIKNAKINILVDGKSQSLTVVDGVLLLNKKLSVGVHRISGVNPLTGEKFSNVVKIISRIQENTNLVMDYGDGSKYVVRIFGDNGKPVGANVKVVMKINKKSYNVKTDGKGYAKLKITFAPKKYDVTVQFKGATVKNVIKVKHVIKAKNISKKKSKAYKYSVSLKKSNGKAIKNKKVVLKINGKTYKSNTNKKGVAIFKIKQSLKVGKYKMKISYNKDSIKRVLTVK